MEFMMWRGPVGDERDLEFAVELRLLLEAGGRLCRQDEIGEWSGADGVEELEPKQL